MRTSSRLWASVVAAAFALCAPAASAQTNAISTVSGTGTAGYAGDGAAAGAAQLNVPIAVTYLPDGGFLVVDQGSSAVRRVSSDGTITTVAGNGTQGYSGDGGPATSAQLNAPNAAVLAPDGSILIADSNNNAIRRVAPNGTVSTVAGTGAAGFSGDNGPAASAQLNFPTDIAVAGNGDYLIADADNHRVRFVSGLTGTISTVAGNGTPAYSGDSAQATSAALNKPSSVALTGDDGFLIADTFNQRVRRVAIDGTITTVAGNGVGGFAGDGGPATGAQLNSPTRVSAMFSGGFLIADRLNNRIRRVTPDGSIETAAGDGTAGYGGDGGPAPAAQVNQPLGVSVNPLGDYLIADTFNHRVRFVDAGASPLPPPPPAPPPPPPGLPAPVIGRTANATPVSGRVLVKLPRRTSTAKARALGMAGARRRFVPLTEARQIPIGSTLDTRRGTVALALAASRVNSAQQNGRFSGGLFVARQTRRNPLTTLDLTGGGFAKCKQNASRDISKGAVRRRRLFSRASGRFRTRGRHSHATVRGTAWRMTDTCRTTTTAVTEGVVVVRDLAKRRRKVVRAGQRYVARERTKRARR